MPLPTDDDRGLLTVVATMRAKEGKVDELRALLESLVAPTLAEGPCTVYALHQGIADPREFAFFELWTDQAALDAHLATPHLQEAVPKLADLLDGDLVIRPMSRIA